MTAHELANCLLRLPDNPVFVEGFEGPDQVVVDAVYDTREFVDREFYGIPVTDRCQTITLKCRERKRLKKHPSLHRKNYL